MTMVHLKLSLIGILALSLNAQAADKKQPTAAPPAPAPQAAEQKKEADKQAAAKKEAEKQEAARVAAEKKEAARKEAEAKKAAEESKRAEAVAKRSPLQKALDQAVEEDRANAADKFDVVFEINSLGQIVRSDGLRRDKAQRIYTAYEGVDLHQSATSAAYQLVDGDNEVKKEKHSMYIHFRTYANGSGASILKACEAASGQTLEKGRVLKVTAKSVPRHSVFHTERELVLQFGWEKFVARFDKKKGENKGSFKKFMKEIEGDLIPRKSVGLNVDKLQVVCEVQ